MGKDPVDAPSATAKTLRKTVPVCPTCGALTRPCKYEESGVVIEGVWCKKCKHVWTTQEAVDETVAKRTEP